MKYGDGGNSSNNRAEIIIGDDERHSGCLECNRISIVDDKRRFATDGTNSRRSTIDPIDQMKRITKRNNPSYLASPPAVESAGMIVQPSHSSQCSAMPNSLLSAEFRKEVQKREVQDNTNDRVRSTLILRGLIGRVVAPNSFLQQYVFLLQDIFLIHPVVR